MMDCIWELVDVLIVVVLDVVGIEEVVDVFFVFVVD